MEPFNLGNYRVIRELGRGGMGVVYLAEDLRLDRLVAIKIMHSHLTQDPEFREKFLLEARNQAKLDHPNITTLFSYEESDDRLFLVMEYLEGETLEERLLRLGRLSQREVQEIFRQVLGALAYAHGKGVIHRDLKPRNIAITPENKVKIMDFGIAVELNGYNEAPPTNILGTPYYMAPEQIKGEGVYPSTDIYTLGVTLFEMLTGRPPFDGSTDRDIMIAHLQKAPPIPRTCGCPTITPSLEGVILKALEKDPQKRFASAQEFLQALETALSAEAEATFTEPASPGAGPFHRPSGPKFSLGWRPSASVALILLTSGLLFFGGAFFLRLLVLQKISSTSGSSPPVLKRSTPPLPPLPVTAPISSLPPSPAPARPRPEAPAQLPAQAALIKSLKHALEARGFKHLKVTEVGQLISITGRVQSANEKKSGDELGQKSCPVGVAGLWRLENPAEGSQKDPVPKTSSRKRSRTSNS